MPYPLGHWGLQLTWVASLPLVDVRTLGPPRQELVGHTFTERCRAGDVGAQAPRAHNRPRGPGKTRATLGGELADLQPPHREAQGAGAAGTPGPRRVKTEIRAVMPTFTELT